ncbi:putative Chitin synthase [Seiridium cardinale]|uniref:Chitin synthase n=1 Tax=Seiridium cardinale TaxID=138064 RepID=A0ABR2XAE2_9PEZI
MVYCIVVGAAVKTAAVHINIYLVGHFATGIGRTRSTQRRGVDFKLDTNGSSNYVYLSEHYSDVGSLTILVTAVALFGTFAGAGIPDPAEPVDHSQEDVDAQSEATVKRALTPFELDKASVEEDKEETL